MQTLTKSRPRDIACDGDAWRHSHNAVHHTYTNILGKDRDLGYSLLRMTPEQRWKPRYWLQPLANLMLAMGFQYGVGSHDLEIGRYMLPPTQNCASVPTLR